jgi:uncharacterized protein (DUF362 family)
MGPPASIGHYGITRRGFLLGAGAGLAAGASLTWFGREGLHALDRTGRDLRTFTGRSVEVRHPKDAMPGPFPGRVIEVHHAGSVRADHAIDAEAVKVMMDRGMRELTGADHATEAWRRLFEPGDVVGIKVNPVGRKRKPGEVGAISSPEVLLEVVEGLKSAGVKARDILVFERYAIEFRQAGYEQVMASRAMDGVRWYAASANGGDRQVDIEGYDTRGARRDRDPHVVGYDPDVFVYMGYASPAHDQKDDRRFRSHLSVIVTRMVNKFVTIPVLKDHRSAGVTLALKNLSHGLNNNVARSHVSGVVRRDGQTSGPNQCNTFIPTAVAQPLIRQKATLHILDGLIGVYEGGPGSWNKTWATWPYRSLFFATDPVALDHVGWDILDAKRAREGWPSVARMGLLHDMPAADPYLRAGRETEVFDRRQPEHIVLAGTIGLGVFDARGIDHRRTDLTA